MSILNMPELVSNFASADLVLVRHSLTHTSALNGTSQSVEFPGSRWKLDLVLNPMNDDDTAAWEAFLAEMDGEVGRCYAGDPWRMTPRGSASSSPGTPVVDGASQTGKSLNITGAPAVVSGWLKLADYFAIGLPSGSRSLHKITGSNVDTDSSGDATLTFRPELRESPADGADIIVSNPTCVMKMVDDMQASWSRDSKDGGIAGMGFRLIEAYPTS